MKFLLENGHDFVARNFLEVCGIELNKECILFAIENKNFIFIKGLLENYVRQISTFNFILGDKKLFKTVIKLLNSTENFIDGVYILY